MNRRHAIVLFATAPLVALAQTNRVLTIEDLMGMGQQFIEDNVDEEALAQYGQLDQAKVQAFLKQIQEEFDQDQVLNLAALRQTAETALKLLESSPVTEYYAQWLRPRLDYFEVAGQLKQPPATPKPGKPQLADSASRLQSAWTSAVQKRPRPAAAAKYETALKTIMASQGVPRELFWLAEIESGFNPKARSPSGAVGMFQLMPKTAQSLGLSTWPFDERKNPEKCAWAAARHLRDLHRQFNDWPLTIAAFNAGAGRVKAALEKSKSKTYESIAAKLPSETQMYVPKLNAVLQLREGTTLARLER
jgi:membrane-bound lytic murein transglycosylase D